jgi:hypothetical protein
MSAGPPLVRHDEKSVDETRNALADFFAKHRNTKNGTASFSQEGDGRIPPSNSRDTSGHSEFKWASLLSSAATAWWNEHPVRAGVLVLRTATEECARRKPLQTLGVAALVGAGIIVLRPWRMASATALALRLFRSSNFTGVAASVLDSATRRKEDRS